MTIVVATPIIPRRLGQQARMSLWRRLVIWREIAVQRRQLSMLDDRALADIGLSRIDAHRESTRMIWDLPERFRS